MKKWLRPLVLTIVFFITIFVSAGFMNKTNEDLTASLEEATLPVVYFTYDGTLLNELHGYTQEMDICSMRGTITPIKSDRMLHVTVETYGAAIDDVHYEIRNLDGSRLIANGEIAEFTQTGNTITFDREVENLLETNQEYMYRLCLKVNDNDVYYYTRIERSEGCYVDECISFAMTFHNYTLNGEGSRFIPTYMDPATGDPTTLNYVDLSCTLNQLTWADFEGNVITNVVASVQEINSTYNIVTLNYTMGYTNENGENEFYNIEEFYRLRQAESRIYVLNFERRMNQIFRGENEILSDKGDLQLGIRDLDVEYKANDSGEVIAFVQQGELWCYDSGVNNIARVFSFHSIEGIDARENWAEHDIKIVSVDEAGSVNFIVYGYMNRGSHEGEVGVAVYHYDGLSHTVEEQIFIPSDESYQVLKADLGKLLYVNESNQLFLIMAGNMFQINLETKTAKSLITGLSGKCYSASETGRYFAWIDPNEEDSASTITFMDLKDLSEDSITESGKYVRPLGFIDEDFIYGIALPSDVQTDEGGNISFAMTSLKIVESNENGLSEIKKYTPISGYISDISIEDYIITVYLERLNGNRYVANGTDSIMNKNADTQENVLVTTTVTEIKETQVQLELKASSKKTAKMITSMLLVATDDTTLDINSNHVDEQYYVYSRGQIILMTDNYSEAVLSADAGIGVVVDQGQHAIWKRAKSSYVNPFTGLSPYEEDRELGDSAKCVSAMLKRAGVDARAGELMQNNSSVITALETALPDATVIVATGCTLDQVLYYVSEGSPVYTFIESGHPILLSGYTARVVYYYDPKSGQSSSMSLDSMETLVQNNGNVFISYIQ